MPFFKGPYCLNPRQSFQTNDINYYSLRKFYERDSAYLGLIEAFIQDDPGQNPQTLEGHLLLLVKLQIFSNVDFTIDSVPTSLVW